jgi:hypothetical protein
VEVLNPKLHLGMILFYLVSTVLFSKVLVNLGGGDVEVLNTKLHLGRIL